MSRYAISCLNYAFLDTHLKIPVKYNISFTETVHAHTTQWFYLKIIITGIRPTLSFF